MILNDALIRQTIISKIFLEKNQKELPKELKIKIMRMRMQYSKIKKMFDQEVKEFTEELIPEEFKAISGKSDLTEQDKNRIQELSNKINSEYQEFLNQKGQELLSNFVEEFFTIDEYYDIVDVNSGNDVEINGNKVPAVDFLEIIYNLFVKE